MDMVILAIQFSQCRPEITTDLGRREADHLDGHFIQNVPPPLSHKDQMDMEGADDASAPAIFIAIMHETNYDDRMQMHKAFRFRLRLEAHQETLAMRTAGCRRLVYNLCLEQRSTWGRSHRISCTDQINQLPELKKHLPFLKEVPSHCLQQAVRDLDRAFVNFFEGCSEYPQPKRKGRSDSFRFPDPKQFMITEDGIHLPKLGFVEWIMHRPILGTPKSVTVSREGNWWFASVNCVVDVVQPEAGSADFGERLGIDLGVVEPIMLSTGDSLPVVRTPKRETRRAKKLRRQMSRQQRGSRNREKTIRRLRHLEAGQARRRLDNAHKAAAWIARRHSHVAMENLKLPAMTKSARSTVEDPGRNVAQKSGLNRALLDLAHGQFREILKRKVLAQGGTFVLVDPRNTSRRCNPCGHVSTDSRKSQAEFICVSCGHSANADHNASENIRDRAFDAPAEYDTTTGGLPGLACGSSGITRRKQERDSSSAFQAA
jgi:putative transposase